MRISDLVAAVHLRLRFLTRAEHADRAVTRVYTTDLLHPERYIGGGDLVLTGLMWRSGPGDSDTFVRGLVGSGASGLGAGAALGAVPADLVEACESHGLPLIEVPAETSFAAVAEEVQREQTGSLLAGMAETRQRHRRLMADLAAGAGFGGVFATAADQAGLACRVVSSTGRPVAGVGPRPSRAERERLAAQALRRPHRHTADLAEPGGSGRRVTVVPVGGRESHPLVDWVLAVDGEPDSWPEDGAESVEELAALAGLARSLGEQRAADDARHLHGLGRLLAAQRFDEAAALLEVAGSPDEEERARARHVVVSAELVPEPAACDLARRVLGELVAGLSATALAAEGGAMAVVPVAAEEPPSDASRESEESGGAAGEAAEGGAPPAAGAAANAGAGAEALRAEIARRAAVLEAGLRDHRLAVGVSTAVPGVAALRSAAMEAGHARRLAGMRGGRAGVAAGTELDSHELLLAAVPEEVRTSYRDRLLGPVLDYDRTHRSDLVATLERFLSYSGSWQRCATAMHVHVNTLRYRIGRVEELTGRDLARLEDRVDFYLALKLHR
ncbi:helix-turn-helix domain-containing protein [Streptomonospora wellingtoniae]|uniref:Helix-turn-helix domain-containing protein n=1 Tax=Streptomonospora wellingtoniae TaxID=3075544 RepID=A0ABU2KTD6_9ACTN|nr:helix-turn-helix domain-containing protein [Streptomonospora sp. DSM 45055]MDT0302532.1 helix-turn-helix domain-containing protein [Streptomonospora sp. DSM 45055]